MLYILRPIPKGSKRLGLEKQGVQRMPGTKCNWVPTKRGDVYLTGLEDNDTLRKKLEEKLGVELHNKSDYYRNLSTILEERPMGLYFDSKVPKEAVLIKAMLASAMIANGITEYNNGVKPYAEWYFENSEADAKEGEEKRNIVTEAVETYKNLSNLKKENVCKILGINVYGLSPKIINEKLWNFIECVDNPSDKKSNCNLFNSVAKLDANLIDIKALIKDAVQFNVIRKNAENDFIYGDNILGTTEDQVVGKVSKDDELRLIITQKVENKLRTI
jgi:hypothetical protein